MVDIFLKKKKKWWQYAPSKNLSTKEQIELFVLICVVAIFSLVWYHFYINSPRIRDNVNACSHQRWELEQRIQKLEDRLKSL